MIKNKLKYKIDNEYWRSSRIWKDYSICVKFYHCLL